MEEHSKKTVLITIWGLAATLLSGAAIWFFMYLGQFGSYHDNQYHFTVQYMKDWKMMEHFQGTAVTFVRPKKTALDTFQPNMNITVQDIPGKIATLDSFSDAITKQMTAVFKENINIIEDRSCTFGGRKGHRLVIAAPKPSNLKMTFVWTIKGSMAYIFTFMAQEKQYDELFPTIKKFIDSFELK